MIHRYKKSIRNSSVRAGSLLISTPVNTKLNKSKLLILITEHNENGTIGIILNKWMPGTSNTKTVYGSNHPVEVQYGGPDNFNLESYLIIYPSIKNGWQDSAFWSYDNLDILTILHFMADYNVQIGAFKGCIQWKPEELDKELSRKFWWQTNNYQIGSVLQRGHFSWKAYAKQYGGFYANLVDEDLPINYN